MRTFLLSVVRFSSSFMGSAPLVWNSDGAY